MATTSYAQWLYNMKQNTVTHKLWHAVALTIQDKATVQLMSSAEWHNGSGINLWDLCSKEFASGKESL